MKKKMLSKLNKNLSCQRKTPLSEIEDKFDTDFDNPSASNTISGYIINAYLENREEFDVGSIKVLNNLQIRILEMDRVTPSELEITKVEKSSRF